MIQSPQVKPAGGLGAMGLAGLSLGTAFEGSSAVGKTHNIFAFESGSTWGAGAPAGGSHQATSPWGASGGAGGGTWGVPSTDAGFLNTDASSQAASFLSLGDTWGGVPGVGGGSTAVNPALSEGNAPGD